MSSPPPGSRTCQRSYETWLRCFDVHTYRDGKVIVYLGRDQDTTGAVVPTIDVEQSEGYTAAEARALAVLLTAAAGRVEQLRRFETKQRPVHFGGQAVPLAPPHGRLKNADMKLRRIALLLGASAIAVAATLTACSPREERPDDSNPKVVPSEKSLSSTGPNSFAPATMFPTASDSCPIGDYAGSSCLAGMH